MVNLQKSQYARQYYINLGTCLKQLGGPERPKEYECHVRIRLTSLMPDETALKQALDLEDETVPDEVREREVLDALDRFAIPFLKKAGSLEGLEELFNDGTLNKCLVDRRVGQLLDPPST